MASRQKAKRSKAGDAPSDHPKGWRRYVYSTNHKDIGMMYLVFAVAAGIVGAFLSVMMRAELMEPGMQIFGDPHSFNVFVTGHGLIMVFFLIMPAMIGPCAWIPSPFNASWIIASKSKQ